MKLVVMTESTVLVEEDKILPTLFEEGMDSLHLYKPETSPMYSERLLSLLSEDYYRKIIVHDHFYLKEEYNLGGIHLDSSDAQLPQGYNGHFSRTCTKLEELKDSKKKANYIFLKNVFDNKEMPNNKHSFTMNELEDAASKGLIDKKVYAMGGVGLDNLRVAKDLGFGGVVICKDLWNKFDIPSQTDYKELILHFEKLKKAIG